MASAFADADEEIATVYARAYQMEMLEESLKRNVIVAVCSLFGQHCHVN
jgi:hypothetical protein